MIRNRRVALVAVLVFFSAAGPKLSEVEASSKCAKVKVTDNGELSCDVKREIVNLHNKYRQQVAKGLVKGQPRASNMRKMYWDDELARGAQEWANHCTFAHNANNEREVARFSVGQNLGITRSTGIPDNKQRIDFPVHINAWFDEHKLFKFAPINVVKDVGHYTQMVWADTYLVGCGYIRYKDSKDVTSKLYVCNYGPAGNVMKLKPYEVGSQNCSSELQKSTTYQGLCSIKKPPTDPCSSKEVNIDDDDKVNTPSVRSARGSLTSAETKNVDSEDCSGNNCHMRRMLSKVDKMEENETTSDLN